MPISPDMAWPVAQRVVELYAVLELHLLGILRDRLARGLREPDWATRKLAEIQELRRELEESLAQDAAGGRQEIEAAVTQAAQQGRAAALEELAAREVAMRPAFFRLNQAAVARIVAELVTGVQATHLGTLRRVEDVYRAVVGEASSWSSAGVLTREQAAQRALDRLLGQGIRGFVDSAGRSWDLSSYVRMATRSAVARTAVGAHLDAMVEAGINLVVVDASLRPCPHCSPWEAKVLCVEPDGIHNTVQQATDAGLFHPGCRHGLSAWFEGIGTPRRTQAQIEGREGTEVEAYEAEQHQRYLERQIRDAKYREQLALTPQARQEARARVRSRQAQMREFLEADRFGLRRRYENERVS